MQLSPEILFLIVIVNTVISILIIHNYNGEFPTFILSLASSIYNSFLTTATLSDITLSTSYIVDSQVFIYIGVLLTILTLISKYKLYILCAINGSFITISESPSFSFGNSHLMKECSMHINLNRTKFYISIRENNAQYLIPIKDLEQFKTILERDPDIETGVTCCRCQEFKPEYIRATHKTDHKEPSWEHLCESCTEEIFTTILEDDSNYISKEIVVSRSI